MGFHMGSPCLSPKYALVGVLLVATGCSVQLPPLPADLITTRYASAVQDEQGAQTKLTPFETGRHPEFAPNPEQSVAQKPFSTFSLDVDTTSYTVVRGSLQKGILPPANAVRTEEMLNYFDYDYPAPVSAESPLVTTISLFPSPWKEEWMLMRVGVKAWSPPREDRAPLDLVLVLDRSGSMGGPDRLSLIQRTLPILLRNLQPEDRISVISYADTVRTDLALTTDREATRRAIEALAARGGTAGGPALERAYAALEGDPDPSRTQRILIVSDGDFNVGFNSPADLERYVASQRSTGIGLSVLGVGTGNFDDIRLQRIAQSGNGIAAYVDSASEARRLFEDVVDGFLSTVAYDAKTLVEFNPATVARYRLLGYETRRMNEEQFRDPAADAGEVGPGHTVTALYEILPAQAQTAFTPRYKANAVQVQNVVSAGGISDEWAMVRVAYKDSSDASRQLETSAVAHPMNTKTDAEMTADDALAALVAGFAERLRGNPDVSVEVLESLLPLAMRHEEDVVDPRRLELPSLLQMAGSLMSES